MPRKIPHVLLVDANEDDTTLFRRALHGSDLPVDLEVIHDGSDAIASLHASGSTLPDLVLLDIHLPTVGGHAVLRGIREHARTRLLPVVMFSGSDHAEDVRISYEGGANSHVRKPATHAEFVQVVEGLVRYWLALNEHPPAGPR